MPILFFSTRLERIIARNDGAAAARLLSGRTLSPDVGQRGDFRDPSSHSPWFKTAFYHRAWSVFPHLIPSLTGLPEETVSRCLRLGMTLAVDAFHPQKGLSVEAREAVMELFVRWAADLGGIDALGNFPVEHVRIPARARAMGGGPTAPVGLMPFARRMDIEAPGFLVAWQDWRALRDADNLASGLPQAPAPVPRPSRL